MDTLYLNRIENRLRDGRNQIPEVYMLTANKTGIK